MAFLENQTLTEHVFEFACLFVLFCFIFFESVSPNLFLEISKNKIFRDYYRFSHIRQKKWIEILAYLFVSSITNCRGSWVVGGSRRSWVWVKVVGSKKDILKKNSEHKFVTK